MKMVVRQLGAFVRNTLLAALRDKMLLVIVSFAALAIGATSTFGALSLHQEERVFYNLVLFANVLFMTFLSIYHGVGAIWREVDTKTITTILSKPVHRLTFLVGKYIATTAIILLSLILLLAIKLVVAYAFGFTIPGAVFSVYYAVMLQLAILIAISMFFASFSSQLLSALLTFAVFIAANLTPQLGDARTQFAKDNNPVIYLIDAALFLLPDLEKLNLSYELTHRLTIPFEYIFHATAYSGLYIILLLSASYVVFRNRDFS